MTNSDAQPDRPAGHLNAVDVIRFLTIGGVILVHSTSMANSTSSVAANGVLQVFHITRSVFLMLSAFVLALSFLRRPADARTFWVRRYPVILVPYLVWSTVYFVADDEAHPSLRSLSLYVRDLRDGHAKYHLYFLLLTVQLYLVFPLLMTGLRRWSRALVPVLIGSVVFELLFTSAVHYGWRPPVLAEWLDHPDSWLGGYLMYVVGGIAAAIHFDSVTEWVRSHYRLVAVAFVASLTLSIASFLLDMTLLGYAPIHASGVFQPANAIEAVAVTAAEYAAGLWLTERASKGILGFLEKSSDVSFGVFLAHPLILGAVLDAASGLGLSRTMSRWPSGLAESMIAVLLVPFLYTVTFLVVDRVRRTAASIYLTGRRVTRPAPAPEPAPA